MALVTLSEYKTYKGINSTTQDALISTLIPKVEALVESYCRRKFMYHVDESLVHVFNGGLEEYVLRYYPVTNVASLEYSSDYGQTYTELVKYTDWVFDEQNNSLVSLNTSGFSYGINAYRVTYNYGYEVLPEELKLAIFDLIAYYVQNDAAIHSNKAPGTNSVQIEYITTTSLPAHIRRVLDLYVLDYA